LVSASLAAEHLGWQSTFFVMAMLTVPVLIFVRIGLRGIRLEAKPGDHAPLRMSGVPRGASCSSARTSGSSASLTSPF
jgi:predicted MFS family arabinose efflux permease